jgi:FKBP-type peptidyl-prolyl cis-trans isomerase FklB
MNKPLSLCAALLLAASGALGAQQQQQPAQQPTAAAPAQKPAAPAPPAPNAAGKPESLHDRASYIIGLNLGRSLKSQEIPVTPDLIVQGLRDGLGGGTALLSEEEINAAMQNFQQEMLAKQQEKSKALSAKNQKEGEDFLAKNKARKEVKATASGLQYEVLKEGTGATPKPTDQVTVHYKGTLLDGTVFDSSYERNEPATFAVNQVIPGWVEALQLMKPGSKYKVYIPASLAYGETGAGPQIGPNSTLVFEIELLSVGAAQPAQGQPGAQGQPQGNPQGQPQGTQTQPQQDPPAQDPPQQDPPPPGQP